MAHDPTRSIFAGYNPQEPPGYARCIDCRKQWESRFMNDIGICAMCRMPVMHWAPNPLLATTA